MLEIYSRFSLTSYVPVWILSSDNIKLFKISKIFYSKKLIKKLKSLQKMKRNFKFETSVTFFKNYGKFTEILNQNNFFQ